MRRQTYCTRTPTTHQLIGGEETEWVSEIQEYCIPPPPPPHTHTHVRFLWIVLTFHRLLLLLYWPNNIFYPLTLNLPLTENLFALLHFQINIIYCFPLMGTAGHSPQCQKCQALLSLWGHLVVWTRTQTHTHTERQMHSKHIHTVNTTHKYSKHSILKVIGHWRFKISMTSMFIVCCSASM